MRYWVYINDKVEGPYEEDKLVTIAGFGPDTLLCSEEIEAGGTQEWVKASTVFEFDALEATVNQPLPVQEDLATAPVTQFSNSSAASAALQPAQNIPSNDVSNILIEKLDNLTREIEDLKSKLDQAISTRSLSKLPEEKPTDNPFIESDSAANTITLTQSDLKNHIQEDALITNTASLVSQAESLIAQVKSTNKTEEKPIDFLPGIDLGATPTDSFVPTEETLPKEGEELILRSALDSLYNSKVQSDEEKEATFQDLLTPKEAADLHKAVLPPAQSLDDALTKAPLAATSEEKDALIDQLTGHPQEDVLSQLIEEKQAQATPDINSEFAADAAALLAGTAAAGVALAAMHDEKEGTPATEENDLVAEASEPTDPAEAVKSVEAAYSNALDLPQETPLAEEAVESVQQPLTPETAEPLALTEPALARDADQEPLQPAVDLSNADQEITPEIIHPASDLPADSESISLANTQQPAFELPIADQPLVEAVAAEPEETHAQNAELSALPADLPVMPTEQAEPVELAENPAAPALTDLPAQKQELNLNADDGQPQLNIAQVEPENAAPQEQPKPEEVVYSGDRGDLPSLDDAGKQEESAEEQKKEDTLQELVPGAKIEAPERTSPLTEADLRETFTERPAAEEMTVAQDLDVPLTPEENQPAPTASAEPVLATSTSLPEGQGIVNPNDLTEIELKEGSTYLISNFVPPSQTTGADSSDKENQSTEQSNGLKKVQRDDLQTGVVEGADVPAAHETALIKTQTVSDSFEEVVPMKQQAVQETAAKDNTADVTLSKIILENTIKTKRGASLDIKTVPMVPEPAQSERLELGNTDLEDFGSQHDLKSADVKPASKTTKLIIGGLVSMVLLAIIYIMLAFMNLIPAQYNLLSAAPEKTEQEQTAQLDEMLGKDMAAAPADPNVLSAPQVNPIEAITTEVQNFLLPNAMTLKQLIEARHPAMKGMIEWDVTTAVDPDNYSVLVKVPPENPQSFKISYRFNYNMLTKALDPTISDSKNLLDSVSAVPQKPTPTQPLTSPAQPMPTPQAGVK